MLAQYQHYDDIDILAQYQPDVLSPPHLLLPSARRFRVSTAGLIVCYLPPTAFVRVSTAGLIVVFVTAHHICYYLTSASVVCLRKSGTLFFSPALANQRY